MISLAVGCRNERCGAIRDAEAENEHQRYKSISHQRGCLRGGSRVANQLFVNAPHHGGIHHAHHHMPELAQAYGISEYAGVLKMFAVTGRYHKKITSSKDRLFACGRSEMFLSIGRG